MEASWSFRGFRLIGVYDLSLGVAAQALCNNLPRIPLYTYIWNDVESGGELAPRAGLELGKVKEFATDSVVYVYLERC
jgi:hypothetical protein